jgi:branched-chain amino acid transport system substrate-binding protein
MALHGIEIQQAANLALSEFDASNLHYNYTLIFEDNQLDGAKSVSAAKRLINQQKVDAVITLWPPTASVVIPLSEKAKILHYTISWDPDLAKKNKFVLSHQAMVGEIAHSTLKLLKSEGNTNAAFLHLEEKGFNLGAEYIRKLAPQEGIKIVSDEAFNPGETDFRSLIERIEQLKPDAYLIWSVMPSIDAIVRQIRERNPKAKITGYLDFAGNKNILQGSKYISEMYASENFLNLYKEHYQNAPLSKGANAYDIIKLLVTSFEKFPDHKPSAGELKKVLTNIKDFPGAVGTFSIDSDGNSSYAPVVKQVDVSRTE